MTYHRGNARPLMRQGVLAETLDKDGVEAMVRQYHALREQFFGGFTYDFGEDTLNNLG